MFKINFQKTNIYSFLLLLSLSNLTAMETPREVSGNGANHPGGYWAYFFLLDQFQFSPPSFPGMAQPNLVPPAMETRADLNYITIALDNIYADSDELANLFEASINIEGESSITAIRIVNPNNARLLPEQLSLLMTYFPHVECLHLMGINASVDVLASLNQFVDLADLYLSSSNLNSEELKDLEDVLKFALPKLKHISLTKQR